MMMVARQLVMVGTERIAMVVMVVVVVMGHMVRAMRVMMWRLRVWTARCCAIVTLCCRVIEGR